MTELQTELEHLVNLMAPPFRDNFKAFCWDKALRLAATDASVFAELPALLKAAMQPKGANDVSSSHPQAQQRR